MGDLLDKLAWAAYDEETRIRRAAYLLRKHSTWEESKEWKRKLAELARMTLPVKGKIMLRREEIRCEFQRQEALAYQRRDRRSCEEYAPCSDKWTAWSGFRDRTGLSEAKGVRRYHGHLLVFLGASYGDVYTGLAIVFRSGVVHQLVLPDTPQYRYMKWTSPEAMLGHLPAVFVSSELTARAVLEGASMTTDLLGKKTVIKFPDGETKTVLWSYITVT